MPWAALALFLLGAELSGERHEFEQEEAETLQAIRDGRGAAPEVLAGAMRALALAEASGGAEHELVARGHGCAGRVYLERGQWDQALGHFESALVAWRAADPAGRQAAEALADVVDVRLRLGDGQAVDALLAELATAAEEPPPAGRARLLELRARRERGRGSYEKASTLARQALQLREEVGDPIALADAWDLLGEIEWFRGQLDSARDCHERALESTRQTLGERHPRTAASQANLAIVAFDQGDPGEAVRLQTLALEATSAARGPDHPETADRRQNLGNFALDLGDYGRALELYQEVMDFTIRRFGPESDEAANILYNLGVLLARTGRGEAGAASIDRAIVIWERARGAQHPYLAAPLDLLGGLRLEAGELEAARDALERAVAIRERMGPAQQAHLAWTLAKLAEVERRQGDSIAMLRTLERASSLCSVSGRAPGLAAALAAIGDVELAVGRNHQASGIYASAVAEYVRTLGPAHPATASARARWAGSLVRVGKPGPAFQAALQAETARREHLRQTIRYLAEDQALDLARHPAEGRDVLLSLAAARGAKPEHVVAALAATVQSRALVFDEMTARRVGSVSPRRDEPLERARSRLGRLLYRQAVAPSDDRLAVLEAAREDLERLERAEAARTAPGRETAGDGEDLAGLWRHLPRDAALISYTRYHDVGTGDERYLAFVLRSGGALRAQPLGAALRVDSLVAEWREIVRNVALAIREPARSEWTSRLRGRALAGAVWEPIARHLGGVRLALVVPDGALALVSFAALPAAHSDAYLVERGPVLHQLSAERDLLRVRRAPGLPGALLALGGPAFDRGAATVEGAVAGAPALERRGDPLPGRHFQPLPGAADEAIDVARLWSENRDAGAARVLVGDAATEGAFESSLAGRTWLHLATHAFFADGLGSPLSATGLALAGANASALESRDGDGLLTAAEVANLDLGQVQGVVLSACGSGLGRIQAGEGVLGLRRAFALAGASAVIMSLWPVDDTETRAFIRLLYRAWLIEGASPPAAVRSAQLRTIARLREAGPAPPALWGAFVGSGAWQ